MIVVEENYELNISLKKIIFTNLLLRMR